MLNQENKIYLLSLARKSIKYYLDNRAYLQNDLLDIPVPICEKPQGNFVTLTINGHLRGCIGHLEPVRPLCQDIVENAVAAAFFDSRFAPLSADEFPKINIEISLLSPIRKLAYNSSAFLVKSLNDKKPGVVIKLGEKKATFLPQVWEDLPLAEEFMSELCKKAGLAANEWEKGTIEVFTYTVEIFHE